MDQKLKTQFETLQKLLSSERNPSAFLNTLDQTDRDNLRPLVLDVLKTKDFVDDFPSLCHRKVWYTFLEDIEDPDLNDWFIGNLGFSEVVEDLIDHYQPKWLEEHLNVNYLEHMRYIKLGYAKPFNKQGKNFKLLESLEAIDKLDKKEREKSLYTHEETISEHIWRFFEEYSPISVYGKWVNIFLDLIKEGKLTREEVMKYIHAFGVLRAKEEHKTFNSSIIKLILNLFKSLEPSVQEKVKMQHFFLVRLDPEVYIDIRKTCIEHVVDIVHDKNFDLPAGCKAIGESLKVIKFTYWKNYKKMFEGMLENPAKDKKPVYEALQMGFDNPNKKIRDAITALIKAHHIETEVEKETPKVKVKKKVDGELTEKQIKQVSDLLLSVDDTNAKIALNILDNKPFPEELITEIALLYHTTTDKDIRTLAQDLLHTNGSEALKKIKRGQKTLATTGKLSETNETTLKNKIKKLVTGNELDGIKFATALFKKYGAGINYLLDETTEEQQEEVMNARIKGSKLDLSGKALSKFPNIILKFPQLTELDLSGNSIRSLPADIDKLKKLKVLNLSSNNIKKIPKKFGDLQKLEELYLQHLSLGVLPKYFFELRALKKLNLDVEVVFNQKGLNPFLANFSKIEEIKLWDEWHSETKIVGKPVDMNSLELARAFLKKDLKIAAYNLYKEGTAKDRKFALNSLYDRKTKSLDVTVLTDAPIHEEIKEFEILKLEAKDSDFGVRVLEAFPEHFKNLESIEFRSAHGFVDFLPSPDLSPFKKLKSLRLSKCRVNELINLSSLKNLEALDVFGAKFTEFPSDIFKLKKLKKLDLYDSCPEVDYYKGVPKGIAKKFKQLTKLELLEIHIGDEAREELQPFLPKGCVID